MAESDTAKIIRFPEEDNSDINMSQDSSDSVKNATTVTTFGKVIVGYSDS